MLAAPVATAVWLQSAPPASAATIRVGSFALTEAIPAAAVAGAPERWLRGSPILSSQFRDGVRGGCPRSWWIWLAGVALLLGRMAAGWRQVRRLQKQAFEAGQISRWQAVCGQLARRLRLTAIFHVVETGLVDVPTVIGWMRPVILLPVAALANLTPEQIEAILAHELAHIRRHDYAVNVLQTLAETLLFYHPAVWWVSARIRAEREHCCDDIAVAVCGDPVSYAQALVELESWRVTASTMALAATGGSLFDRVRRIVRVPVTDRPRSSGWLVTFALIAVFTAGAGAVDWLSLRGDAPTVLGLMVAEPKQRLAMAGAGPVAIFSAVA